MNFFRKQQQPPEQPEGEPATPAHGELDRMRQRALDALVPASAKSPEKQRLTMYDLEEGEDDQEELQFLSEIARAAERARGEAVRPKRTPSRTREQEPDDLHFFREMTLEREHASVARTMKIDEVDLGDLLEDLSTTAAALRRRKAA